MSNHKIDHRAFKMGTFAKSPVRPPIHQGERVIAPASIWFSVHGEVSNHEGKAGFWLFANPSTSSTGSKSTGL